jgi:hypothetical protein
VVVEAEETNWNAVAARSLALIALKATSLADESLGERARFLMSLGINRKDSAALLNTTDDSLRHILRPTSKRAVTKKLPTPK